MLPVNPQTNRLSIISFSAAVVTVLLFGLGLLPIPFTDWICYSLSGLFSMVALVTGTAGLRQIRRGKEKGAILSWIGMSFGFLSLIAICCLVVLVLTMFPLLARGLEQIWKQVRP